MSAISLEKIVELCERAIKEDNWYDWDKCTAEFNSFFSQFAEALGYQAQYKDHPKEFLSIDHVWWADGRMVAAIEHENDSRKNMMEVRG